MTMWTIDPRDPLVARDGRPNNGRSESIALPFPYPGTIAGIARTRLGADARGFFEPKQDLDSLRRAAIRGPVLAGMGGGLYVPRPRDVVALETPEKVRVLRRLMPLAPPTGALFDESLDAAGINVVGLRGAASGKAGPIPSWWPWATFERWLSDPNTMDGTEVATGLAGAFFGLSAEGRSHVKLTETWTAEDAMFFQVRGWRLRIEAKNGLGLSSDLALALAFDLDAESTSGRTLRPGVGPCGGKRRLAYWQSAPSLRLPDLCRGVRDALAADVPSVRVRVVLLTPAVFAAGWRPGADPVHKQLLAPRAGVKPTLVAACVPRAETISGWDFAKGGPKATRRLVSSGSVYWIDLEGAAQDRVTWAEEVMMKNVSDTEQDRRDGFGLAAVGVGA